MEQSERKPVFSVIIPTYNREKLIGRAIDSVLNQTFKDFELIIVDDGSTDNTKEIIERYTDQRIRYIYKENGGQNSALNVGIGQAFGRYIAFLDSDDLWVSEKLAKVYALFKRENNIDVIYHSTGISGKNGTIIAANEDCLEGHIYKQVLTQEFLACQISFVCRKECFNKVGLYDENLSMYSDDDMCFRLAKYYKVGLIKEILSIIGGGASNRVSSDIYRTAWDYNKLILKYKKDILKNCGKQKVAEMYFKNSLKYGICRDKYNAKKNFSLAKQYDIQGKYRFLNIQFIIKWNQCVYHFKILKSKIWQFYMKEINKWKKNQY